MKDLTVLAIPAYFGSMAAEHRWQQKRADQLEGSPGLYEKRDTIASLAMGVGSLVAPLVLPTVLRHVVPGKGRYGKALVLTAAGAAAVTTLADVIVRASPGDGAGRGDNGECSRLRGLASCAGAVQKAGGVTAVAAAGLAVTTSWTAATKLSRFVRRTEGRRRYDGPAATAAAILAWDFIYYWNHRAMHESRFMWAIHVVHHSSERYNLSTALRQPVADAFGTFLPYSVLTLAGIAPGLIETARGVNLVYQFWIHTDSIDKIGPLERILNTPSHHRVHHGSNGPYLDRNHGSILIVWDRLFGTFEPEGETVVYGLTKNIDSYSPARIATHEYAEILKDVARSTSWRDRIGYVVRGPGWAGRRRAEQLGLRPRDVEPGGQAPEAVSAA